MIPPAAGSIGREMTDTPAGRSRPTLGLVLGGGGARGLAHIGVLHALAEADLHPDVIVGVSMGAVIGATYAARPDWLRALDELDRTPLPGHENLVAAEGLEFVRAVVRSAVRIAPKLLTFGRSGGFAEFGGQIMHELLDGEPTFADLRIPFATIATDVHHGRRAVLAEGDVTQAVIASAALPIMTSPIDADGGRYLEGGFADPAPIDVARTLGADVVLMVHVGSVMGGQSDTSSPVMATLRGFEIGLQHFVEVRLGEADLVVAPQFRDGISWLSFDHAEELVDCGRDAMGEALPALKALL